MAQPCPTIEKKFKHLMSYPLDHPGRPCERGTFVTSTGRSGTDGRPYFAGRIL